MAKVKTGYTNNVYAPRSMTHELDFSMGMKFVDGTVEDKYVRALVNFDIKDMGASLVPRKGLRTTNVCIPDLAYIDPTSILNNDHDLSIYAAHDCIEDGKHYKQFVLGKDGDIYIATTEAEEDSIGIGDPISLTQLKYSPDPLLREPQHCTFFKPKNVSIHGVPMAEHVGISTFIGAFGFNNNIFFFDRSGAKPKLCYTKFDEATHRYTVNQVEARELTAAEAPLTGYNMLHETPYTFEDTFTSSLVMLQGVLPYADDGSLLLKPKRNQAVKFRCYLTAAPNTKYKFLWESRGVSEMSWVSRQKQVDVVFTESGPNAPLYCTFVPPEADTQIRVQVFQKHEMDEVIDLIDVSDVAPTAGMVSGDKYFNPKAGKLYTYGTDWGSGVGITVPTNELYYYNKTNGNYYRCYVSNTMSMLMLDEERYDVVCDHQLTVGYDFKQKNFGDKDMVTEPEVDRFDLTTATGLAYWNSRLVVYGLPKDPTIMFMSDFEDYTYFPYPNNLVMFDEPIVHAVPFMDDLIVFTEGAAYALTPNMDGASWNRTKIQGNLWVSPWDRHMIQVVRNMVYFKSGNYPYMIVPKATSMTGELTLAPISTPIKMFLDNFATNVDELFEATYGHKLGVSMVDSGVELVNYYNYLDYEDVHNIYVFYKDQEGENDSYVHLDLLYNTVSRAWKVYIYEAPFCLVPYKHDATQPGKLCSNSTLNITSGKNYEYHLTDPLEFTPINAGEKVVLARNSKNGYNVNQLGRLLMAMSINTTGDPANFDNFRVEFCDGNPTYVFSLEGYDTFYYEFNSTDIKVLGSDANARLEVVSVDGLVKLTQFLDNEHANTEELILESVDPEVHLIPYVENGKWFPLWHDTTAAPGVYTTLGLPILGSINYFGLATPTKDTMFRGHLLATPGDDSVVVSGLNEYILPCPEISIVPSGDEYLITITGAIEPSEYFAINTGKRVQTQAIQIIEQDRTTCSDFYIPYLSDYLQYGTDFTEMLENTRARFTELTEKSDDFINYKNYQFLDSGYRDVELGFNKRYRELQLNLTKVVQENFNFGIDFLLDGEPRPQSYDFLVDQYADPEADNRELVYLTLASTVDLGQSEFTKGTNRVIEKIWSILQSKVSTVTMWKLRINLSGKGNAPRFRFVSRNEYPFELTKYAWVYRIKNAR